MTTLRPIALALLLASPLTAGAAEPEPIKVVEDALAVPAGMSAAEALAAVDDLPLIFEAYQPVVPKVPGVKLGLTKEVLSTEAPVVMALPVEGAAFGRPITEQAQVTATSWPLTCDTGEAGLAIELSFAGSSWNVERRVDRIEITACPRVDEHGGVFIDTRGALYEGALVRDPEKNALEEGIGAKALQTAFLKQVPAVFDAVERTWAAQHPPALAL